MSGYNFKVGEHIKQTRPWAGNAKNAQLDTVWRVNEILIDATGKPRVYIVVDTGNPRARGRTMAPMALAQGQFTRVPEPEPIQVALATNDGIEARVARLEQIYASLFRSVSHTVTAIERINAQQEAAE